MCPIDGVAVALSLGVLTVHAYFLAENDVQPTEAPHLSRTEVRTNARVF